MEIILYLRREPSKEKYMFNNPELKITIQSFDDDNNELIDEVMNDLKNKYRVK